VALSFFRADAAQSFGVGLVRVRACTLHTGSVVAWKRRSTSGFLPRDQHEFKPVSIRAFFRAEHARPVRSALGWMEGNTLRAQIFLRRSLQARKMAL
jgi:hypothetical protein